MLASRFDQTPRPQRGLAETKSVLLSAYRVTRLRGESQKPRIKVRDLRNNDSITFVNVREGAMTTMLPLIMLSAAFVAAAYALRPPAFIPWPGYRWISQDVAKLRVSLAGQLRAMTEDTLERERDKNRHLRGKVARLEGRAIRLEQERDAARDEAAIVARLLGREEEEEGSSEEGASSPALKPRR
jgi:hypothetical protein